MKLALTILAFAACALASPAAAPEAAANADPAAAATCRDWGFTTCSGGCTGDGCTGNTHDWSGEICTDKPTIVIQTPGTNCALFRSNANLNSWQSCNSKGVCTQPGKAPGASCFRNSVGNQACNTKGTDHFLLKY